MARPYAHRGKLDVLNTSEVYPSPHAYGIPEVTAYEGPLPSRFVAWPNRKRKEDTDGLHMFVDDTRFEPLWTSVDRYRRHYAGRVVCSPDFSMYTDWPALPCMWNTYRSRWLARAMAERGALVIPAVTWAGKGSFGYCFEGLARGGSVAISAYGAKRFEAAYRAGYEAMLERLEPRRVVVVGGVMPSWMRGSHVVYFASNTLGDRRAA